MPTQPNLDSIRTDTGAAMTEYVRSDVSVAIVLFLIFGVVAAVHIHWTALILVVMFSYMAVGISVTWEWNQKLREEGMVPRMPFSNVTATAFIPTLLAVAVAVLNGVPFVGAAMVSLLVLVSYLFILYTVGFIGLDADELYFKRDPFEGDERVFTQDVYIPRLEQRSIEKAQENREADE